MKVKKTPKMLALMLAVSAITFPLVEVVSANIGASYVEASAGVPGGTVEKTALVKAEPRLSSAEMNLPTQVSLVDKQANAKTAALYAYLKGLANSGKIIYGHQNDMHHKVNGNSSNPSDTYDVVGDYPGMVGFDIQAVEGGEFSLTPAEAASGLTLSEKMANICIEADRHGAILTMSCHLPNFAVVAKKPMKNGKYDYTGYSSDVRDGNVVKRILPDGDLNPVFNGYLDMLAEFDQRLQQANVPVIVRPFHENTGSWFWWGAEECTPQEYRDLFRYTVTYLRDRKGLHNILYAYSPGGGEIKTDTDYPMRYPGDGYVDIIGFDMYHRDPEKDDGYLENDVTNVLNIVEKFASRHDKAAAVTETGILSDGGALLVKHNRDKTWFSDVTKLFAQHHMSYFLTWSNDSAKVFFQPYMVDNTHGHEMINEFIQFYNMPESIFASQNPDLNAIKVTQSDS